jgi:hypothetical protein
MASTPAGGAHVASLQDAHFLINIVSRGVVRLRPPAPLRATADYGVLNPGLSSGMPAGMLRACPDLAEGAFADVTRYLFP